MSSDILVWTTLPLTRNWKKSAAVILFLSILFLLVYYWIHSVVFVFIIMLMMIGSLSGFFFPTEYELNSKGVIVKSLFVKNEKPWSHFRSFYPDKNGILLSPFPRPSRLENFRGLYIRFENNRDQVIEYVKKRFTVERAEEQKKPAQIEQNE